MGLLWVVVAAGLTGMLQLCYGHGQQGSSPRSVAACMVRVIALVTPSIGYRAGVFGYKCCRVA